MARILRAVETMAALPCRKALLNERSRRSQHYDLARRSHCVQLLTLLPLLSTYLSRSDLSQSPPRSKYARLSTPFLLAG